MFYSVLIISTPSGRRTIVLSSSKVIEQVLIDSELHESNQISLTRWDGISAALLDMWRYLDMWRSLLILSNFALLTPWLFAGESFFVLFGTGERATVR